MRPLALLGSHALAGAFASGLALGLLAPVVASWFRVASRRARAGFANATRDPASVHRLVIDGAWPADPAGLASRAGTETNSRASFLASECPTDIFVVYERW
jgi:hypothetical protein